MTPDQTLRYVRRRESVSLFLILAADCFETTPEGKASLVRREARRMARAWQITAERYIDAVFERTGGPEGRSAMDEQKADEYASAYVLARGHMERWAQIACSGNAA